MSELDKLHTESNATLDNIDHIETLLEGVLQEGVSADDVESAKALALDVPALECFDTINYAHERTYLNHELGIEALHESVDAAKNVWVQQAGNYIKYVIKYISEIAPRHDDRNFAQLLSKLSQVASNALEVRRSLKNRFPGVHIPKAEQNIHNRLIADSKLPHTPMVLDTFSQQGYASQYEMIQSWKAAAFATCQYYLNAVETVLESDVDIDVQDTGLDNLRAILKDAKALEVDLPGNSFKVDFEAYIADVFDFAVNYDDDHGPFFNTMLDNLQSFGRKVAKFKGMKRKDMSVTQANVMSRAMRSMNAALYYITQTINAVVAVLNTRFNQRLCVLEYITYTIEERTKAITLGQPDKKDEVVGLVKPIWDSIRDVTEELNS